MAMAMLNSNVESVHIQINGYFVNLTIGIWSMISSTGGLQQCSWWQVDSPEPSPVPGEYTGEGDHRQAVWRDGLADRTLTQGGLCKHLLTWLMPCSLSLPKIWNSSNRAKPIFQSTQCKKSKKSVIFLSCSSVWFFDFLKKKYEDLYGIGFATNHYN